MMDYIYNKIGNDFFIEDAVSLEDFIHHRTKILGEKLGVLLSEMNERLVLKNKNQLDLDSDKERLEEMIHKVDVQVNYGLQNSKDKTPFLEKMFDLNKEKRDQDTTCWLDSVRVMRDFLDVWDAHEQALAKSRLLNG